MSAESYIHGTDPAEQQRLAALNRMTNRAFIDFLAVPANGGVLEVGSGLGLLAFEVAESAGGVQVWGVERSPDQIAAAVRHPRVSYVHGDAHHLDFPDGTFDLAYARYVLEHVADPLQVVREMRRVTRPGGRVAACENDVSLFRVDPPCRAFDTVFAAFQQLQVTLGGDSLVGRRLYRLFREAGLSQIELSVQPEVHWHGSPGFAPWLRNIIGIIEGAREGLLNSGLCDDAEISAAIAQLIAVSKRDDASSIFVWNRAVAIRT
ncbi:MAG TPA: methyltransferase domain-containing protein [Vicinamibacterales bacterium]|jgi:SAM-dependent methyltransferase